MSLAEVWEQCEACVIIWATIAVGAVVVLLFCWWINSMKD